jgi:plastocyanin
MHGKFGRRMFGAITAATVGAIVAVPVLGTPATAAPATTQAAPAGSAPVTIGVDNAAPPQKNWEYTHYFPENNVNVPQGGTVLFAWNHGSLNGLHSVTFVPTGKTVAQERAVYPPISADPDNGETETVTTALSNNPTNPACLAGPGGPPCVFDGTSVLSSGIIPNSLGAVFPVQIAATTAPGTYTYFCIIHQNMQGTLTVVPAGQPATDPGAVAAQAGNELNQLNGGAAAAEAANSVPTSTPNADGTSTWTVHVGVTADDVELLEYLPRILPIRKGDSVKYDASGTTQEIHTVTSPAAANQGLLPFSPNECEAASGPDTQAANVNGPPQTGCADPSTFEQPLNLHSLGEPSVLTSGDTSATSAFISGAPEVKPLGAETSHTFKFANNGTYQLFCVLHQNMGGAVSTPGYRVGTSNGGIYTFGAADFFGSKAGTALPSPVVATPATFDNQGYWLVTADGHTYNYGAAASVGNGPAHLASPIVGAAATPDNGGLWLVAKDGGVFGLGDATFMGSMGGKHLNSPIVGISGDFNGSGYDLVAADGGVFNFGTDNNGNSRFVGSMGGKHLNSPIVGIVDNLGGGGYWLAAADGGVFNFGKAAFQGSLGATHLNAPIVSISGAFPGNTYRLGAADGGVFTFGPAPFFGSAVPSHPAPAVTLTGEA